MKIQLRSTVRLAAFGAACTSLFGQAPSAPASGAASNDNSPIELSAFEVQAPHNRGYIASETMTGSRIATKIQDLPYTVNVLTSEFFEDFALFELGNNVAYIGSFTALDQGGGYTLRGFSSSSQLRDGFYRLGRYGSSNVDRIEVIKGPNAAIYGQTSPGGMINMISKKPSRTARHRLALSYGEEGLHRETFDSTGPVPGLAHTYYIVTLGNLDRDFPVPDQHLHNTEAFVALQHYFKNKASLLVSGEFFLRETEGGSGGAPLVIDQKGTSDILDDSFLGYAQELTRVQRIGPNSELDRGMVFLTGTYEQRFDDIFSARVSANYYRARRWDFNQIGTGAVILNPPTGTLNPVWQRSGTPSRGRIIEDGGGLQADLLAHTWLRNRTIENRTLLTFDYNVYYRFDPQFQITEPTIGTYWNPAQRNIPLRRNANGTFAVDGPIYYYPKFWDWKDAHRQSRSRKNRTTVTGTLLRNQSAFFQGRLLAFLGARYDNVSYSLMNQLPNPRVTQSFSFTKVSPNAGFNFKLRPNLAVYGSYSESIFANQQGQTAGSADPKAIEGAQGYDYGFKGSFLNGRVNYTLGGFYILRQNVAVSLEDRVTGELITRYEGSQLVRGWEADLNWSFSDNFMVGASYGNVNSRTTNLGYQFTAVGRRVGGVPPGNGGAYTRYEVTRGPLKGFSTNLGVTYTARTPSEGNTAGDVYGTAAQHYAFLGSNNQWKLTTPSVVQWNLGMRYTLPKRTDGRRSHTIGFNINNLLDKNIVGTDPRYASGTYTLTF